MVSDEEKAVGSMGVTVDRSAGASYEIFRKVTMTFWDMHTAQRHHIHADHETVMEIDYCHEGCMESEAGDQIMVLGPGDVLIHRKSSSICSTSSAQNHFHGISIDISDKAEDNALSVMLNDLGIDMAELVGKYTGHEKMTLIRSNSMITHIFASLYNAPEEMRVVYAKSRLPELMFQLNTYQPDADKQSIGRSFSKYAISQTKAVGEFLRQNTWQQVTIAELARKFCISQTVLKESFKRMYGENIAAFSRRQRMEKAAELLRETDMSIMDIAEQVGYSNASKFATMFRSVMGAAPSEFRR